MKNQLDKTEKIKFSTSSGRKPGHHITITKLIKELLVPPENRTENACQSMAGALFEFIKSIPAFKQGFLEIDALAVARQGTLRIVDNKQAVFTEGDVGKEFYIVLQGAVAVKVNNKIIEVLGEKTSFGENSLECKCKRSSSVMGAEAGTKLLVIRKQTYTKHLAKTHRQQMISKLKFIKKLRAVNLTSEQVAILCTCIKMQKVTRNQKICSHEDTARCLYYLIRGCADEHTCDNASMLRNLLDGENGSDDIVDDVQKFNRKCMKDQNAWNLQKQMELLQGPEKSDGELHRMATLLTGQMFGEASWVHGSKVMTTIVARSDCKMWVLSFTHVDQLVKTQKEVRKHLEQLAKIKLQFRLARLDTLRRATKCLNLKPKPVRLESTTKTKAWTDKRDGKPSASAVAISTPRSSPSRESKGGGTRHTMPLVRQGNITRRDLDKSCSLGRFLDLDKTLPRVSDAADPRPKRMLPGKIFKQCDQLKYRFSDKYNRANRVPRDLLASVVDDFNAGNPELAFPQQQLVTVLGNYLNSKHSTTPPKKKKFPVCNKWRERHRTSSRIFNHNLSGSYKY